MGTTEFDQSSKFQRISMFPENIWKSSRKMWKFDILSAKSISVSTIEWKWCPIHWNWPNIANSWKFPDFQNISGKNPEKWEIWNSEFKIKLSDVNWVGKICNILKLAKTSQFPGISKFPIFLESGNWKFGNLEILRNWLVFGQFQYIGYLSH